MKKIKPDKLTPFKDSFGNALGRGKDNIVVELKKNIELVVKWNHDPKTKTTNEEHFNKTLYKKNKYEMLKFFLGDFIPKSSFVLGNKLDGDKIKTKEYTIQERVPQVTVASLTKEQKSDPRLLNNLHLLIKKLQHMYKILNIVNSSIEDGQLDGKLDLGGLSKYAEEKKDNEINDFDFDVVNYNFMDSPNLLVDPETMQLYCIDFDQGKWSEAKDATLTLVKAITKNNNEVMKLINTTQKIVPPEDIKDVTNY